MRKKIQIPNFKVQGAKPLKKSVNKKICDESQKSSDNITHRVKIDDNITHFEKSFEVKKQSIQEMASIQIDQYSQNQYEKKILQSLYLAQRIPKQQIINKKMKNRLPAKKKCSSILDLSLTRKSAKIKEFSQNSQVIQEITSKQKLNQCKESKTCKTMRNSLETQKKNPSKYKISLQETSRTTSNPFLNHLITSNSYTKFPSEAFMNRLPLDTQKADQSQRESIKVNSKSTSNLRLNKNLQKQLKKKNKAAILIQKIWRGYQTRKLLQEVIREEEQKLVMLLKEIEATKINKYNNNNNTSKFVKLQSQQNIVTKYNKKKLLTAQSKNYNKQSNLATNNCNNLHNQNNCGKMNIFRHKPIYGERDAIQIQQIQKNYKQQCLIIYETPEQYAQSKETEIKSSHNQIRQQFQQNQQNRLKIDKNKNKKYTSSFLINESGQQDSPSRHIYTEPQESITKQVEFSTKSFYKYQIEEIKKAQIQKWEKMIRYIRKHITNKQDNDKFGKLINKIIDKLQQNKNELEQQKHKQKLETLQTRVYTNQQQYQQIYKFAEQLSNNKIQSKQQQKDHQSTQIFNFKKKKTQFDYDDHLLDNQDSLHIKVGQNQKSPKVYNIKHQNTNRKQLKSTQIYANYNHVAHIISMRQKFIKKKEYMQYQKLYELIQSNKISLIEFQNKIQQIQIQVQKEIIQFQRQKEQIEKGLILARKMIEITQREASELGIQIHSIINDNSESLTNNKILSYLKSLTKNHEFSNETPNKLNQEKLTIENRLCAINSLQFQKNIEDQQFLNISVLEKSFTVMIPIQQLDQISEGIVINLLNEMVGECFITERFFSQIQKKFQMKNTHLDIINGSTKSELLQLVTEYVIQSEVYLKQQKEKSKSKLIQLLKNHGVQNGQDVVIIKIQDKSTMTKENFEKLFQKLKQKIHFQESNQSVMQFFTNSSYEQLLVIFRNIDSIRKIKINFLNNKLSVLTTQTQMILDLWSEILHHRYSIMLPPIKFRNLRDWLISPEYLICQSKYKKVASKKQISCLLQRVLLCQQKQLLEFYQFFRHQINQVQVKIWLSLDTLVFGLIIQEFANEIIMLKKLQ